MTSVILKRAGLSFCGGACVLSPLAVFLALPPFYSGIWVQVETVVVAIHLCAATAALGLLLLACGGQARAVERIVCQPVVVVLLLAFVWSVATLPFVDLPSISWFGAPEHGMGAIIILDLAALLAAAIAIRAYPRLWYAVVAAALISAFATLLAPVAAVVGALTGLALPQGRELSPYFFSDYRAFYALYVAVLLASLDVRWRRAAWVAALAVGGLLLYASHNKAAIGYAAAILPTYAAVRWWARDDDTLRRIGAWSAMLLPIVLTILVYGAGMVVLGRAQSGDALAQSLLDGVPTVWSRALMTHLALVAIAAAPASLVSGYGWGHFGEVLLRHLNEVPVRLYLTYGTKSVPFWDAVSRFDFHSHNLFVESLLAGGIIGVGLALAWMAAIAYSARDGMVGIAGVFALLYAAVGTFWFQMPVSVPVMALALAALAGDQVLPISASLRRAIFIFLCGIGPVLQIASAATGAAMAARGGEEARANRDPSSAAAQSDEECRVFAVDSGIGDAYLAWLTRHYFGHLAEDSARGKVVNDARAARLRRYLCATDRRLAETASLRLMVTSLNVRAGLVFHFDDPVVSALVAPYRDNWGQRLERLLTLAPGRTDLATAYMNWLLAEGKEGDLLAVAERLLSGDPNDRVGLWFSGIVLIGESGREADGMARLRRSLDNGIEDILPIDADLLKAIRPPVGAGDRPLRHD